MTTNAKRCTNCNLDKPRKQFYIDKRTISGLAGECKECSLKRSRLWALSHPERRLLSYAKYRAAKHSVPFSISREDVRIPDKCPVLGISLCVGREGGLETSPSIDRIIPQLGYVPGNVIVISMKANQIKNNANIKELGDVYRFYSKLLGEQT